MNDGNTLDGWPIRSDELDQLNDLLDRAAEASMRLADIGAMVVSERNDLRNEIDRLKTENAQLKRQVRFLGKAVAA